MIIMFTILIKTDFSASIKQDPKIYVRRVETLKQHHIMCPT